AKSGARAFRPYPLALSATVADNRRCRAFAFRRNGHPGIGGGSAMVPDETGRVEQWLAEARAGCPGALGRLLHHCRGYLLRVAAGPLDPSWQVRTSPSDLVQQAYLEVLRIFDRFT